MEKIKISSDFLEQILWYAIEYSFTSPFRDRCKEYHKMIKGTDFVEIIIHKKGK